MQKIGVAAGPLVGRDRLVAALEQRLDALEEGRGCAVLLAGEPGAGKTRLLEELAVRAGRRGLAVAWGRCIEGALVEPCWPWHSVLRSLGLSVPAGARRAAWVADVLGALAAAGASTPLVVCLDDLHWADEASLRMLHVAVAELGDAPVLLAGARRVDVGDGDPRAGELLAALPAAMIRIAVEPLAAGQVGVLVTGLLGGPVAADVLARVAQRTGGNPFFVREVAALLAESSGAADTVVPAGVQDVLGRRLARLPAACRVMLDVLSVLGEQARIDDLAAVCGGPDLDVRRVLDPAVRAGLVRADPARRRVSFTHGLVRDAVYQAQPPEAAAASHRKVAETLGPTAAAAVLCWHWRLAAGPDAARRAARYALSAGRAAMEGLAFEQAAAFFSAALELDDAAAGVDEIAIRMELADALLRAGDSAGADEAWWEAATRARRARRPFELARAAVGFGAGTAGFEVRGHDPRQTGLLEDALGALPGEPSALRALVLARLSVSLGFEADAGRRESLAAQAVSVAVLSGDANALVQALAAFCDAHAGPADAATRAHASARMLRLARQAGDAEGQLLAFRFAVVASLEGGDFAAADAHVDAFERVAVRLRQPHHRWYPPLWRGMRAAMAGRVTEAAGLRAEAEAIGQQANSFNAFLLTLSQRMTLDREYGDVSEVLAVYDDLLTGYVPVQARATLAAVYADTGDLQRAQAMLTPFVLTGLSGLPVDAEWLSCLSLLSRAAIACGDTAAAGVLLSALAPFADRWVIDGIGAACWGVAAETMGRLAIVLGEYEQAAARLDQARAAYAGCGALLLTTHALQALAQLAAARGDAAAAGADLAQYTSLRQQLGLGGGQEPAGSRASAGTARAQAAMFVQDGPVWTFSWRDATAVVPDAKGLHDLASLLARPGRPVHVLDLAGPGPSVLPRPGQAEPVLDATARAAYRRRLGQLEEQIADAGRADDARGVAQLTGERDFIARELAAALGLGGRPRTLGDPVERARKAVGMRIAASIARIETVLPALARHLRASVRTGRFCSYDPEQPVDWQL